ncbi:unnamed protein product [Pleuronectes platessa]|uniref:Uncharacterized protein n=1 Tax=Pleuronectes platessa TaxID=8262 RepID=A0A9N7VYV3_PLEPL|nr:unnamed protein product [Pleuronectes platessa]
MSCPNETQTHTCISETAALGFGVSLEDTLTWSAGAANPIRRAEMLRAGLIHFAWYETEDASIEAMCVYSGRGSLHAQQQG